ncbi:DEAD/DEAH box helicase family protein [Acanthopleuribacter pedis]|uniref:DEAD/DEAH box helicase family protein n=1 Tax=Acanthopleuribacter pedis TaxID=442870 RepID=A0A8J7U3G0_9BACT|nr:DEAD/DEAH box helicase family protein [Acanthopleuribacter pedis]MBO1320373.1 DEAD/DEAH box helicase family protein [Acanthopleuribacter pedis]
MSLTPDETDFEAAIEAALIRNGYSKRLPAHYDEQLCLDSALLLNFIRATQPAAWAKAQKRETRPAQVILDRVSRDLAKHGALHVLRHKVRACGESFRLAAFKPRTNKNPAEQHAYAANCFSLIRQLVTDKGEVPDLVLFLNGLPLFTVELKNQTSGQNVKHGLLQFKNDRNPSGGLYAPARCLAHFAVDTDLAYVTTVLAKQKTQFLPYNRGHQFGAGNPPTPNDLRTAYLWEDLWTPDSVLELVDRFIHRKEDKKGRAGKGDLIFPRYHQRDAVRRLIADAGQQGPGKRYLIQHSAGSGKSYTIAWLALRLAQLFDDQGERVFHTIVVLTDRRVLDRQLQNTIGGMQRFNGQVENIDQTSRQLRQAISDGKNIIVTTQQKFPVIEDEARATPGRRFAIIIDEAHSSQDGETSKSVRKVLGDLAEAEALETAAQNTLEDRVLREAEARRQAANTSVFAFTATPKKRTLELFGEQQSDGSFQAFSLYSMRQAVEERFIMDVLANYTTYQSYWELTKTIEEDPRYQAGKAGSLLVKFVELHPHAIRKKVEIMVDHFANHTAHRIHNRAKAMIVTRSRLHAVRYIQALRGYLKERGLPFKALVAFTDKVTDPKSGKAFTEAQLNGFPDSRTVETFKGDDYRFMVVANKFQTGFDQPLLHTMYVDKKLSGVAAVQTLSRLNRMHPGKEETFVLDFANDGAEILAFFQQHYQQTRLARATDRNQLFDLENELLGFQIFDEDDIGRYNQILLTAKKADTRAVGKLNAVLDAVVERYLALEEARQKEFKGVVRDYVKLYSFLGQLFDYAETGLEKLYYFVRDLARKLPVTREEMPTAILDQVNIKTYNLRRKQQVPLTPEKKNATVEPVAGPGERGQGREDIEQELSTILEDLNQKFGLGETPAGAVAILAAVVNEMVTDFSLENAERANAEDKNKYALAFKQLFEDKVIEHSTENKAFLDQVLVASYGEELASRIMNNLVLDPLHEWRRQIKGHEGKKVEFKSTLRWNLREGRKDDVMIHSCLKSIAAFMNSEGGHLFIGVDDDGKLLGIELDQFEDNDKFGLFLAEKVQNHLGTFAAQDINAEYRAMENKTICRVLCKPAVDPVFLKWKKLQKNADGDLYVRTGPSSRIVPKEELSDFIRQRFPTYWELNYANKSREANPAKAKKKKKPAALELVTHPPQDQRFTTCVPKVDLRAAAGLFSESQDTGLAELNEATTWVKVNRKIGKGWFAAEVHGRSMEPTVADGSLCLFAPIQGASKNNKTLLIALRDHTDPEHGGRYTLKIYRSEKQANEEGTLHNTRITLAPKNPEFEEMVFTEEEAEGLRAIGEFRGVLG